MSRGAALRGDTGRVPKRGQFVVRLSPVEGGSLGEKRGRWRRPLHLYLATAQTIAMLVLRVRTKATKPSPPKPASIIAQVDGSGTPGTVR